MVSCVGADDVLGACVGVKGAKLDVDGLFCGGKAGSDGHTVFGTRRTGVWPLVSCLGCRLTGCGYGGVFGDCDCAAVGCVLRWSFDFRISSAALGVGVVAGCDCCDGCEGSVCVDVCVVTACFLVSACFCAICCDLFTTSFVAWTSDSTMVTGSPHLPGAERHAMFGGSGGAALTCV